MIITSIINNIFKIQNFHIRDTSIQPVWYNNILWIFLLKNTKQLLCKSNKNSYSNAPLQFYPRIIF